MVKGKRGKTADFKWNAAISAGPEFIISSWVITPRLQFDYIHDGSAPLFGAGIYVGAGYLFGR